MALETLQDLMIDNLKDLYHAEKQLVGALPLMAKGAKTEALRQALEEHLTQTRTHVNRLEEAFELLGLPPRGKTCHGMEGLIAEGKELLDTDTDDAVRDAGIIAAAQRVEHYEIAGYGCVITYAELLGQAEVARLLENTLDEEKKADQKLTQLAHDEVNARAADATPAMSHRGSGSGKRSKPQEH
jgi:ferritin-like metal-binding protein YciE